MRPSDLENLALRYVPGEGAIAIDPLGAGLVNESYRVARGGRLYSLRVPAAHAAEFGLDRGWECRVLECAAAAGIAPLVECCDPCQGILVMRWAGGRAWTVPEVRRAENIDSVAQLARRIHALPAPQGARIMSPAAWIAYYQEALIQHAADTGYPPIDGRRSLDLRSRATGSLAALTASPPLAPVLCHSDLHRHNVVVGEHGLILLDWEYAHVSEPLWDLAGWICNNDLNEDSRQLLLARYLDRGPTSPEAARLKRLVWLYDYVCFLWCELYSKLRPGGAGEGIFARGQLLAERLEHGSGRA